MRFSLPYVSVALVLFGMSFACSPAHADAKLLPPMENDGTERNVCAMGGGNKLLAWDGEHSLKCTSGITVDNSGHVGIGTTSPTDPLSIRVNSNSSQGLMVSNTNSGGGAYTRVGLQNDAGNYAGILFNSSASNNYYGGPNGVAMGSFNSSGNLGLFAGNNLIMTLTPSGNVGIGTASPQGKLDVGGMIKTPIGPVIASGGGSIMSFELCDSSSNRCGTGGPSDYLQVDSPTRGSWAVSFAWYSDERMKDKITDANYNALDKLKQIRFISYNWKPGMGDTDHRVALGFSAQNLKTIEPEWVQEIPKGKDKTLLLSPNEKTLIPTALKGIVELSKQVDDMRHELDARKNSITQCDAEINKSNDSQVVSLKEENKELRDEIVALKVRLDALEARGK